MRTRIERRIRKQLRRRQGLTGHAQSWLATAIAKHERQSTSPRTLETTLRSIALHPGPDWHTRGLAAQHLLSAQVADMPDALLRQFLRQQAKDDLWLTALVLESTTDMRLAKPLIRVLQQDPNPDRRHAAARTLGWLWQHGSNKHSRSLQNRAADALAAALTNPEQPQPVREEAAESLAYLHNLHSVAALISALSSPDVRIRFWAVFALGSIRHPKTYQPDPRAFAALESCLEDHEFPPGNWWSVAKEALDGLYKMESFEQPGKYTALLEDEVRRVRANPDASKEDIYWAEGHDEVAPRDSPCG